MVGADDETATATDDLEAEPDLVGDLAGGAEGQGVLLIDGAPETEAVAEFGLDGGGAATS